MKEKSLIGNTPLIKINYLYNDEERHLFAKLEYYNLTGSIKDRLIYYCLGNLKLDKDTILVEATSGNTGIALAAFGARYGHEVHIFMPDFVSKERANILKLYGAHVHLISKKEGGFKKCVSLAREFANLNNGYLLNQFSNQDNFNCHYNTTGLEIINSLNRVDKFVSGIGTGGTLMGCGCRLKEKFGSKIVAIEPDSLPILTDSNAVGSHKIDGIGDDFVPDIVNLNNIDEIVEVNDSDAINMAFKLARELGIGVGVSSGANFIGCVLSSNINEEVVTIFADDNKKYLSVNLDDKNRNNFVSDKIKLINFELIN